MDINVKNDESHSIANNRTQYVGENETLRVVKNQNSAIKGDLISLTGKNRSDKVVNKYTLSAGETLRLECGESAIELSKDGNVNIIGNKLNFTARQSAEINTLAGGLYLNPDDGSAAIVSPGWAQKVDLQHEIDSFFVLIPINKSDRND
jgi:type VI secretion system secreted protein VgrG